MYPGTFQKVGFFILASIILSAGMTLILTGPGGPPSAMVVLDTESLITAFNWPIFLFGIAIGGVAVAAILFVAQYEVRRL